MMSLEQRLAQSDPVVTGSYVPQDYSAMIARVTATRPARRDPQWRAFRARMGSAVAATSLLTGLGVAALGTAGSALPVLGFAAAASHQTTGGAKATYGPAASSIMAINPNAAWQFVGADAFSHAAGTATAFAMSAPTDGAAALSHVASVLGLDVGTPATTDGGQSFSATGAQYSGWLVQNGGYATWGIDSSASGGTVASSPGSSSGSSTSAFTNEALRLAGGFGDFQFATPSASSVTGGAAGGDQVDVTVPILVQGNPSDFSVDIVFGADGTVLNASGPLFTLTPIGDYPLISPADAVGQISAQLALTSMFAGGVMEPLVAPSTTTPPTGVATPPTTPVTSTGSSGSSVGSSPGGAASPPTSDTTPSTPTTVPAPTVVDLTGVSLRYGVFALANGTTALLPLYVYDGTVAGDGGGYQVSFRVVPVEPSYLNLATVQGPIRY